MIAFRKFTHRMCFFLSQVAYITCCCGCCSALRPRYKRLVDNIFPATPQEGLVKSNMEKLTFYSLSSPEKLDRIGEYLFQKASRDIYRRRHGFVVIAMEAMDQLLVACHAQTLNLFVESFLKMVQKLLESPDPQLQILATQSFVRFANIEEDTPSYHRRYDFFVSKFSAMCHSNHSDKTIRNNIRMAGIRGLQGVIRKTVSDDLVENIWEAQHMDKIVPSLLYNMQSAEKYETVTCMEQITTVGADSDGEMFGDGDPPLLAEACLRELVGRASFGHIRSVLRPVLTHFDRHELWVPNDFALHTFKVIMFSIQAQYSYSVVETLMSHLDNVTEGRGRGPGAGGSTRVRTALAQVLSKIIAIAAGDSIGPSVLEIINNLLTHLRTSVTRDSENETDEKQYQEALINGLGEFADHLPDYQKIDIMMFIMNKVPGAVRAGKQGRADAMLQTILLKSLLKVGTTYKTSQLSKAFPGQFLDALLRMVGHGDPPTRVLVQRILHTLLDRHKNQPALSIMTANVVEMDLNIEKCSRQDMIFINKHGPAIFSSLYEGLQLENNSVENVEAVYTTLALLCVELVSEDVVCDMATLFLAIQQSALANPVLSRAQRYHLHAVVVSLLALLAHVHQLGPLHDYIKQIVEARQNEASHLLPSLSDEYEDLPSPSKMPYLMVDQMAVCESLKASGIDPSRLQMPSPYAAGAISHLAHRHSWVEVGAAQGRDSLADITAGPITELDSANSSPGVQRPLMYDIYDEEYIRFLTMHPSPPRALVQRFGSYLTGTEFWYWKHEILDSIAGGESMKSTPNSDPDEQHPIASEGLTLDVFRRAAAGPTEAERREMEQRRVQLNQTFRNAPFAELIKITQPKNDLKDKLEEIFLSLSEPIPQQPQTISSPNSMTKGSSNYQQPMPPYQKYFPELFLY